MSTCPSGPFPTLTFARQGGYRTVRNVYIIDNNNKISKGRVVRECEWGENSFVLWDVGIAGRDAYVRDSVVCVWSLSIVRITNEALITYLSTFVNYLGSTNYKRRWLKVLELKIKKCHQLYVALHHRSWFNDFKNVDNFIRQRHASYSCKSRL